MVNPAVISGFLSGLTPAPRIFVSDWACQYRYMTSEISPEPGLYDVRRTPYLEDIMNDLSPYSPIEEVVFKKSSQVGATQAGNNWIGSIMHLYPAPTLMVLPNEELARRNSKANIDSMIRSTPALTMLCGNSRDRDSGNTVLSKKFPGGFLIMSGSESPNAARSTSFRYIYLDELSAYPVDMGGEGDPYDLFVGRSKAFGSKRKIFSTSTPTVAGQCRVSSLYEETDKRRYHVPCPCCGELQTLDFDRLRWKEGIYSDVYYECVNGCRIEERHKPKMLSKEHGAKWIPTAPSKINPKKKGYHISALYTPLGWYSWATMAEDYDKALNHEHKNEKLKTFTNTMLGETWDEKHDVPDYERIMDRAIEYKDGYPVQEVAALTAGVDIQKNRIEVEVLGWGTNRQTWSVDYKVLEGSTDEQDVWYQLRDYLNSDFPRPDGSNMQIDFTCIDSGYLANTVYEFCNLMGASRCVPIKGGPESQRVIITQPKTVDINRNGTRVGTTMLRHVGQSVVKEMIYSRLKLSVNKEVGEIPPGMCYFPKDRGVYYFKGLCSEVYVAGKNGSKWEKVSPQARNEPLDLRVYAHTAGYLKGLTKKDDKWFTDQIASYVPDRKIFTEKKPKARRKDDFWNK